MSDADWKPTAPEDLLVVDVLERVPIGCGRVWHRRAFSEVRKGDTFRTFNRDGAEVDPRTGEEALGLFHVALSDAFKSDHTEGIPLEREGVGYSVEVDTYDSFEAYLKGTSQ